MVFVGTQDGRRLLYPGEEPEAGDGKMKITLSQESADMLVLLEEMRKWRVQPTMTRGANSVKTKPTHVKSFVGVDVKKKRRRGMKVKKELKEKKEKKKKKKHIPANSTKDNVQEIKAADDIEEKDIRRGPGGQANIRILVQDLYDTDRQLFPKNPCFDEHGKCRMSFQGASLRTWEEILDASPATMESMYLVNPCCRVFCSINVSGQ